MHWTTVFLDLVKVVYAVYSGVYFEHFVDNGTWTQLQNFVKMSLRGYLRIPGTLNNFLRLSKIFYASFAHISECYRFQLKTEIQFVFNGEWSDKHVGDLSSLWNLTSVTKDSRIYTRGIRAISRILCLLAAASFGSPPSCFYFASGRDARYCDKRVCMSVCLHISTRRPASADRTARAANFRRDLEAT